MLKYSNPVYFVFRAGIVGSSGSLWKEQRKTSLEILREFGLGKNLLADRIQEEVTHYIRAVEDHQGAPADLTKLTQVSVSNNICSIVFGRRFQYDDPDFIGYISVMDEVFRSLSGKFLVLDGVLRSKKQLTKLVV